MVTSCLAITYGVGVSICMIVTVMDSSLSLPLGTLQRCVGHSFSRSKRHHTIVLFKKDSFTLSDLLIPF